MTKTLLADFTDWLDESETVEPAELVNYANRFMRWRADAPLDSLSEDDIRNFLLDWCPRQRDLPAEVADGVCEAMVEFCLFLGYTRRLWGGVERGRSLARLANGLANPMRAAIVDQINRSAVASVDMVEDLSEVDLVTLASVMRAAGADHHSALLAAWRPTLSDSERAGIVAAWITESVDAGTRLFGLKLLGVFDTAVAEPYMRQLLDTAAAGHAAIWLLDHGLADGATVGRFISPAIMVDILSQLVEHPDVLCEQFLADSDPFRMLECFWRHPAPETAVVLAALARHLPDRVLAKEARRAELRHRSWMANTRRV